MTFDGKRNDDIYLLRGRTKSPYHGLDRNISQIGGNVKLQGTKIKLLPINQPIGFKSDTQSRQMDIIGNLTEWLITDDWSILSFDDEPGRKYEALLVNDMSDFEKIATLRQGTLEFIARSTLGLEKTLIISSEKQHEITGQTETPWQSKTVFNASTSQYKLSSKTGELTLNFDFVKGDVLRINYETRSITLNGVNIDVGLSLNSEWFELEPGYMTLSASHETEIYYTERFH